MFDQGAEDMSSTTARQRELARIDHVLETHSLKKTPLRRSILLAFTEAKTSLTQAELIEIISKDLSVVDRVSIYRNLAHLKDAGVLHEVDANNYVFCSHECEEHAHLLLFCQTCHKHQEVKDHDRISNFMSALGNFRFFGKKQPIFLRGVCTSCTPSVSNG
jgi:Fur family zinc uptake transcriptional regulator